MAPGSPYKGKHSMNRRRDDDGDGKDSFEGLVGADKNTDFAEFCELEEKKIASISTSNRSYHTHILVTPIL